MAAVIGLGVFGGQYLDNKLALKTPWFTLALSLFSVGLAIYLAIKDFIHHK
jgi:4-hydroxybenzoate polyprenyltransferase